MGYCEDKYLKDITNVDEIHLDQTIDDQWREAFQYSLDQIREMKMHGGGGFALLNFILSLNVSDEEWNRLRAEFNSSGSGASRKQLVFNLTRKHMSPNALDAYQDCLRMPRVDYEITNDDQDEFWLTLTYHKGDSANQKAKLFQDALIAGGAKFVDDTDLKKGTEFDDGQPYTYKITRNRSRRGNILFNFTNRVPLLFVTVAPDPPPFVVPKIVSVPVPAQILPTDSSRMN
jgi:hypothetical protein